MTVTLEATLAQKPLSQQPENAQLLAKIMSWDFSKVENRYRKMYPDRDAIEARRQFCIFVYLTLATGKELYIPATWRMTFGTLCCGLPKTGWLSARTWQDVSYITNHFACNPLLVKRRQDWKSPVKRALSILVKLTFL